MKRRLFLTITVTATGLVTVVVLLSMAIRREGSGMQGDRAASEATLIARSQDAVHVPKANTLTPLKAYKRTASASDELPVGLDRSDHAGIRSGDTRKVAAIEGPKLTWRGVYLSATQANRTCVVIADATGAYSAGCSPPGTPFASGPLLWTSAIIGGPGRERITEVIVGGVVQGSERVAIVDVSGVEHDLTLSPDAGFAYTGSGPRLPATIIAYTLSGSSRTLTYSQSLTRAYDD